MVDKRLDQPNQTVFRQEFTRAMRMLGPRMVVYLVAVISMTMVSVAMAIVESFAYKDAVNAAVEQDSSLLWRALTIYFVGMAIVMVLNPICRYLYQRAAHVTAKEIRLAVFDQIMHLPFARLEEHHSGDLIARLTTDVNTMIGIYTNKLRRFIAPVLQSIAAGAAMFMLDWRIAAGLLLFNLAAAYINIRFVKPIRHLSDLLQKHQGAMTERLIDLLAGFPIMKMYHIERQLLEGYTTTNVAITDRSIERSHIQGLLESTNYLLGVVSNLGTMAVGAYLVLNDLMDVGTIVGIISLQGGFSWSLLQSASYLPQVQEALAGGGRVYEVLDWPREPERYPIPSERGTESRNGHRQAVQDSGSAIAIDNIHFGYQHGHSILNGLTLHAQPGQMIALVGPSGAGKSTVFKLLMGYYPATAGIIMFNGRPLGTYALTDVRDLIAYVPQDAYLYDGTILENIRYGRLDADEAAIERAARLAHAHDFISATPSGYQTLVGERGTKLSGGQRQRIAIARALLKDAPILLLDEATSALDSQSEAIVQDALKVLMQGRTTLVIAHRLSTIQDADRIYVLDQGTVSLNSSGLFQRRCEFCNGSGCTAL